MNIFQEASHVSIQNATFNEVGGNQTNNYYTTQVIQERRERTIYDEFKYIKLGNVYTIENIYRRECVRWNQCEQGREGTRFRAERTICTAEIYGKPGRFTVMSYSGPEATEAWEEDFRQFSQSRKPRIMQLFGINKSIIPMLIFYNELVPLGHMWGQLHGMGKAYLCALANNWRCNETELWIDSKQGSLIRGVEGPSLDIHSFHRLPIETLSSSIEILQEDIVWRYLSQIPLENKFDDDIVEVLEWESWRWNKEIEFKTNRPIIFSAITNSTVAVGSLDWESSFQSCLDSGTVIENGKTRFTLVNDSDRSDFELKSGSYEDLAWLMQASGVFHNLGISLDGDLSNYSKISFQCPPSILTSAELIVPDIELKGQINDSRVTCQRRLDVPPIYLFVISPPLASLPRHFWSYNETGHTQLSNKECKCLGLPTKLRVQISSSRQYSWSTEMYQDIHRWQVLRGFDPKTADFAYYLGHTMIYEIVHSQWSQFEELDKDDDDALSLDLLFSDTDPHPAEPTPQEDRHHGVIPAFFWTLLMTPFSYEAVEGSDIPAVVI